MTRRKSGRENELGRQTISGQPSAEPAQARGLETPALPVRFTAKDAAADGQTRTVEIDRERVLLRRSVRGMAIRVSVPHNAYRGVSLRLGADGCAVGLEHRDPALSVILTESEDEQALFAQWDAWARALSLPLMIGPAEGECAEVGPQAANPSPRRRRRNAVRQRRPAFLLRRRTGSTLRALPFHREREIIARG